MIRLRRLIRPSLILYIRNYTPLNGDRHFRVKNYESNLSRRLFDSIRKFESIIIRWCRKKIVTVAFSFFLWPSHRDSKWINWRSNRSGRDGGAASNDVYMAQITWSTIRGRDNRDDPFSFPARDYSTLVDFSTKGSAVGNWWSPLVFAAHYIPVISHATDRRSGFNRTPILYARWTPSMIKYFEDLLVRLIVTAVKRDTF